MRRSFFFVSWALGNAMHYYQFNIGDYKSHTEHLSDIEDLAYRRLLDWYYLHETPIPLDIQEVARQIRMRTHTDCIATVLQEYFIRTGDGWTHGRADKEIAKTGEKSSKASESAKERWKREKEANAMRTHSEVNANALRTECEGNATHNTIHITQDTEHNSLAKAKGAKAPLTHDEIIFGYGVPLLTNSGTPDKQARSFLGGLRKSHGDDALVDALRDCIKAKPLQPLEWLAKVLPPIGAPPKRNKQEQLEDRNRAVVARMMEKEQLNAAE